MQNAIRSFVNHLRLVRKMSENTIRAYSADLNDYAAFLASSGVQVAKAVRESDCGRFLATLEARGRRASTRRRRLAALRGFHAFCLAVGLAGDNPAMALPAPRASRRLPTVLTEAQVAKLIDACGDDTLGKRDRAMMELAYSAALRVSELVGIDLEGLDMHAREARVMGKGSIEAIVPFGARAHAALAAYLTIRERLHPRSPALFLSRTGRRIGIRSVHRTTVALARRAGVPGRVHPHALRHSCATHLSARGADLLTIKELLRHKDISTTLVYTHFDRARIRQALKRHHPRG